mmetsp:Transcript_80111/g.162149  ORF Transcript_80111/g.162149 Transcript_80111/m.162149 type:complete len:158 (+) Transcript_80111:960-1433(+)
MPGTSDVTTRSRRQCKCSSVESSEAVRRVVKREPVSRRMEPNARAKTLELTGVNSLTTMLDVSAPIPKKNPIEKRMMRKYMKFQESDNPKPNISKPRCAMTTGNRLPMVSAMLPPSNAPGKKPTKKMEDCHDLFTLVASKNLAVDIGVVTRRVRCTP